MRPLVLPTIDRLGTAVSTEASPVAIAQDWLDSFTKAIQDRSFDAEQHFVEDGFWRDVLSLSSDFRTIHGTNHIQQLVLAQLNGVQLSSLRLAEDASRIPVFRKPFPDLTLLQLCFDFETRIGKGSGICRLVQPAKDQWKAYTMFTCLDSLKDFPEMVRLKFLPGHV